MKYSDDFSWEKIPFQQIKIVLEVLVKFHLGVQGGSLFIKVTFAAFYQSEETV